MDKAVIKYRKRRQKRLDSKSGIEKNPVEEYRKRREMRLNERFDAGIGWAYGLAKSKGIDTSGMTPDEVFKALKEAGETVGNRTEKNKNNNGKNNEPSNNSRGSSYVDGFKTNSGKDFPKPKKGAVYDEDTLKEVNRLAREGGKDEAYDAVMKNITEKDLVYQKDPDGTVVAAIPGLSNMYDNKVRGKSPEIQKAYDERIAGGKKIAQDMVNISNQLGSRMMGLENCFKGGESTARKIDKVKKKLEKKLGREVPEEEAFASMDDVVRFSYKCDHEKMVDQIKSLEKELEKNGYRIVERDNKFLSEKEGEPKTYKAVHLAVLAPNGEVFEAQIQSEETIKVKNKNHAAYEKQRVIDTKEHPEMKEEYDRLEKEMVENTADMPEPPGIMELPTIKKKK